MNNWNLVSPKEIRYYIDSEDYSEESVAMVRNLYSFKNSKYPILCISAYPNIDFREKGLNGFRISCQFKNKNGEWWEDYHPGIPLELIPDLMEILAKINSAKTNANE